MAIVKKTDLTLPKGTKYSNMTNADKISFVSAVMNDIEGKKAVKQVLNDVLEMAKSSTNHGISDELAARISSAFTINGNALVSEEDAKDVEKVVRGAERYAAILADARSLAEDDAEQQEDRINALNDQLQVTGEKVGVANENLEDSTPEEKVNYINNAVDNSKRKRKTNVILTGLAGLVLTGALVGVSIGLVKTNQDYKKLQEEYSQVNPDVNVENSDVDELNAIIEELQEVIANKESENEDLKEENQNLKTENSEKEEIINQQKSTIDSLQSEVDEFKEILENIEIDSDNKALAAVAMLISNMVTEIDPSQDVANMSLTEAVDFVDNYIGEAMAEIAELEAENAGKDSTIATLRASASSLKSEISDLKSAVAELEKTVDNKDATINDLVAEGLEKDETINNLEKENAEKDDVIDSQLTIITSQGEKITLQESQIESLIDENNGYLTVITTQGSRITALESENEDLKEALAQSNNSNQSGSEKEDTETGKTPVTGGDVTTDTAPGQGKLEEETGREDDEPGF